MTISGPALRALGKGRTMSERLIKQEWIDKAVREHAERQELLLALALSLGAKSMDLEWYGVFERKTRFLFPKSRRLRRKALKLAIERLEMP